MRHAQSVAKDETLNSRRRWIHPSVWLAALPLLALLVYLNVHGEVVRHGIPVRVVGPNWSTQRLPWEMSMHGWPRTFLERQGVDLQPWSLMDGVLEPRALLFDILVATAILALAIAAGEFHNRRRGALWRWSLRDLLVAVCVLAIPFAWWKYQAHRADKEREIAHALEEYATFSIECRVPFGLSRLVGRHVPAFERVTGVEFRIPLDDNQVAAIAPRLDQLTAIEEIGASFRPALTDEGLAMLVRSRPLRILAVDGGAATGAALANLPDGCLWELVCINSKFDDEGLAAITNQTNLENLDLVGTSITDKGVRYLTQLPRLRRLEIFGDLVTDEAVEALGRLASLEELVVPLEFSEGSVRRLRERLPLCQIERDPSL